jgi:cysteinyl-tRNA synthetase
MSQRYLGETFDIHGGGEDLIFPHHENEIAQSEGATGKTLARYWVHNGFVRVNSEKMSKSLGNFFTIRDILQQYHPEVLRLFLLQSHYRSPVDFSDAALNEARQGMNRFYATLKALKEIASGGTATARKMCGILGWVTTNITTATTEGGMMVPSDPPAQMVPEMSALSYL